MWEYASVRNRILKEEWGDYYCEIPTEESVLGFIIVKESRKIISQHNRELGT